MKINKLLRPTKPQLAQPIKTICDKCNGEAWIIPITFRGICLCSRCTFGEDRLSLNDMLLRLFNI